MKKGIVDSIWTLFQHILPPKAYLGLKYLVVFKRPINWKRPETFSEKLQWIKLYGCKPEYGKMADKVLAKEYVSEIIGEEYIIPTLGKWKSFDAIDFDTLPNRFVLKCNHDSGTAVICRDKSTFNQADAGKILSKALKRDYYKVFKETPYKDIKRMIFAEKFIQDERAGELLDYKFFCFDGKAEILKIDFGRAENNHHANYYDLEMNLLPFGLSTSYPMPEKHFSKPENFSEMIRIAEKLSEGIPFVRVDLYNVSGRIYFGELTFFPGSGLTPYTDVEADKLLGSRLHLPYENA